MEKMINNMAANQKLEPNKALVHAGYAQFGMILLQSILFPNLGAVGASLAAVCGMMPWAQRLGKQSPSLLFGMVMASLVLSPVFGTVISTLLGVAWRVGA